MKTHRLSRSDSRRLSQGQSGLAEGIAADAYGYSTVRASNFDAARESGAVLEVKSTMTRLNNGERGRFRLWKSQHDRLTRQDRNGSARYAFVLFDVSQNPPVAKMKLKEPAEIGRIVGGRGGWNQSGHHQGKQRKIPYSAIF